MKSLRNSTPSIFLICLISSLSSLSIHAQEFSSTTQQTQLIELYTSEGCSSCPPADRWLTELKATPGLWRTFVPVAYHVDYWDYIGWVDRFAKPAHAARQRQHAAVGNLKTVYTPGFVVDGMEWRGWFKGEQLPKQTRNTGRLIGQLKQDQLQIRFEPTNAFQQMIVTVAVLGSNHVSEVKRGENANRTLKHDFAVISEKSQSMERDTTGNKFTSDLVVPFGSEAKAIAIWVSPDAGLRPLQATGGWLARN